MFRRAAIVMPLAFAVRVSRHIFREFHGFRECPLAHAELAPNFARALVARSTDMDAPRRLSGAERVNE
jgi:hypothetical protein